MNARKIRKHGFCINLEMHRMNTDLLLVYEDRRIYLGERELEISIIILKVSFGILSLRLQLRHADETKKLA